MSELTINTTQNVTINFSAASIGERIGAHLIDLVIKFAYCMIIFWLVFTEIFGKLLKTLDEWTVVALWMIAFLPVVFYSFVLEATMEGQTLGKKLLRIKVVKIDGYQASFGDYLIRWLFCVIDTLIFWGAIGLVTMVANKKVQRLGDISAGTAVITLKNKISINQTILEDIGEQYLPIYPLVIKLSDNDVRIIKETFTNAIATKDLEMIQKLRAKIETVTGTKNQSGGSEDFVRTVLKDYNFYTQNM